MKALDFIFAGRPMLLLPVWSIFLVSLHYHHELARDSFGYEDLLMLLGLSLLAAGAYYINQVYDVDSDARNDKLGFLQHGLLSARSLSAACLIVSVAAFGLTAVFSFATLMIYAQLFVIGYLYSAPPFRLKDRAFWGLAANAWSFGMLIPLSVMPGITQHNAGLLGWDNPFYFLLAVGSIYCLTTIPDREGDRVSGKRTLAVILPVGIVKLLALILMAAAAAVAFASGFQELVIVALVSLFPILLSLLVPIKTMELAAAKLPILLLTLLAGSFYWRYFVFVVFLVILTRIYYMKRFRIIYPRLF